MRRNFSVVSEVKFGLISLDGIKLEDLEALPVRSYVEAVPMKIFFQKEIVGPVPHIGQMVSLK